MFTHLNSIYQQSISSIVMVLNRVANMLFEDLLAITIIEKEEMANEGRTSCYRGSTPGHASIQHNRVQGSQRRYSK